MTGDCVNLGIDRAGRLIQTKPAYGGNIVSVIMGATTPQLATVRARMFEPLEPRDVAPAIDRFALGDLPASQLQAIGWEDADASSLDEAAVVVLAGPGVPGDRIGELEEICRAHGAALGGTREVCEARPPAAQPPHRPERPPGRAAAARRARRPRRHRAALRLRQGGCGRVRRRRRRNARAFRRRLRGRRARRSCPRHSRSPDAAARPRMGRPGRAARGLPARRHRPRRAVPAARGGAVDVVARDRARPARARPLGLGAAVDDPGASGRSRRDDRRARRGAGGLGRPLVGRPARARARGRTSGARPPRRAARPRDPAASRPVAASRRGGAGRRNRTHAAEEYVQQRLASSALTPRADVERDVAQHFDVLPDGSIRRRSCRPAVVSIYGELVGAAAAAGDAARNPDAARSMRPTSASSARSRWPRTGRRSATGSRCSRFPACTWSCGTRSTRPRPRSTRSSR